MARSSDSQPGVIEVAELREGEVSFCLLGYSPFYCNSVAQKAMRELLLPRGGRLTPAQKAENLKHDPDAEFRASPYLRRGVGPTRILMKATAIKDAIAQAAIDMPTAVAKTQINRLTYVVGEYIDIWGVPLLDMEVVRLQDMKRTPDIRTRAKLVRWATRVTIRYQMPMLNAQKVATLLQASGQICGIGDFRQEKGKGNNGLYRIVAEDNADYLAVLAEGGMEAQDAALASPQFSNPVTEDLYHWYHAEILRRADERDPRRRTPPRTPPAAANGEAHA